MSVWPPKSSRAKVVWFVAFICIGSIGMVGQFFHDQTISKEAKSIVEGDPLSPPYIRIPIIYPDRKVGRVILANSSDYPAFNVQLTIIDIDTGNRICCNRTFEELYSSATTSVSNPILMNLSFGKRDNYRWRTSINTRVGVYDQRTWLSIQSDGTWNEAWIVKNEKGAIILEGSNPQEFQVDWLLFESGG